MKDEMMRKVQFVHVRQVVDGQIQPKGGMTFCYFPFSDKGDHIEGYSFCSKNDLFNKSRGRYKALGRSRTRLHAVPGLMTMEEVTSKALYLAQEKDRILAKRFNRPVMNLEVCPRYKGRR